MPKPEPSGKQGRHGTLRPSPSSAAGDEKVCGQVQGQFPCVGGPDTGLARPVGWVWRSPSVWPPDEGIIYMLKPHQQGKQQLPQVRAAHLALQPSGQPLAQRHRPLPDCAHGASRRAAGAVTKVAARSIRYQQRRAGQPTGHPSSYAFKPYLHLAKSGAPLSTSR